MNIKRKKKKNKRLVFIILALLILIPTVAALFVLMKTYPGNLKASAIGKISVTNPDGVTYEYTDEDKLKFFASMYNSASEIENPAHNPSDYRRFNMTIDRTADDIVCDILLTDTSEDCLLLFTVDGAPVYKNIVPEHAAVILADENFVTAYTYYMPPKLTASIGETEHAVSPKEMDWQYRKNDGSFYNTDVTEFVCDTPLSAEYKPEKYISLSFELTPDLLSVEIFDGENPVFADKYDSQNYRSFTYNKKADLRYVFTAEWIATSSSKYCGKAVYEINVKYLVDPVGIASSTKLTVGDFMAYTVHNIAQDEPLTANDGMNLEFFDHNGAKVMLYPTFPDGFVGEKQFTVTDGDGFTLTETLEIALPKEMDEPYELHESLPENLYVIDYADPTAPIANLRTYLVSDSPKMWDGAFADPVEGMNVILDYMTPIARKQTEKTEENGENDTEEATEDAEATEQNKTVYSSFTLISPSSDDVRAAGHGKIVFSGEMVPYGNTIIIDHGLGICSFYANLEDINFVQGEEVTKGLTIGTINSAGYALIYGVSVNGYFVNPASLNFCLEAALI